VKRKKEMSTLLALAGQIFFWTSLFFISYLAIIEIVVGKLLADIVQVMIHMTSL